MRTRDKIALTAAQIRTLLSGLRASRGSYRAAGEVSRSGRGGPSTIAALRRAGLIALQRRASDRQVARYTARAKRLRSKAVLYCCVSSWEKAWKALDQARMLDRERDQKGYFLTPEGKRLAEEYAAKGKNDHQDI